MKLSYSFIKKFIKLKLLVSCLCYGKVLSFDFNLCFHIVQGAILNIFWCLLYLNFSTFFSPLIMNGFGLNYVSVPFSFILDTSYIEWQNTSLLSYIYIFGIAGFSTTPPFQQAIICVSMIMPGKASTK